MSIFDIDDDEPAYAIYMLLFTERACRYSAARRYDVAARMRTTRSATWSAAR